MKKRLGFMSFVMLLSILVIGLPGKQANAATAFIWPVDGSHTYSRSLQSDHNGIDITKYDGAPIKASASGKVIYAQYHSSSTAGSYGNLVAIESSIGGTKYITKYAHMKSNLRVSVGQWVNQGTVIGYMGNTGDSRGSHLHLEILKNPSSMWNTSSAVEPLDYLAKDVYVTPTYHKWDGSFGTVTITKDANTFSNPGWGINGSMKAGERYKIYSIDKSTTDDHYFYGLAPSTYVREDYAEIKHYIAEVHTSVSVYNSPNGSVKRNVSKGDRYKTYIAKKTSDGKEWYDLGQNTWIEAKYVNVEK